MGPEVPPGPNLDPDLQPIMWNTPEFRNQQPALAMIKADKAYERGLSGKDVLLGIYDESSVTEPLHPEFSGDGKLHIDSYNIVEPTPPEAPADPSSWDPRDHGYLVAGVAAAARDEDPHPHNMHGVAFNSSVYSIGGGIERDFVGEDQRRDRLVLAFSELNAAGVVAVNNSWGQVEPFYLPSETEQDLRAALGNEIAAMAQASTPIEDRAIYVWSAGNDRREEDPTDPVNPALSPDRYASLPYFIPELRGHFITVVSVDTVGPNAGRFSNYSNHCGQVADWCMAAPGAHVIGPRTFYLSELDEDGNPVLNEDDLPVPRIDPDTGRRIYVDGARAYAVASGTSFSAPMVTGAIALLEEAYRGQLGSNEIVARLFATANKNGVYANQNRYGQGLLDLDAATRPQGETSMPISSQLSGPAFAASVSSLSLGPAIGDAFHNALKQREIALFDEFDAPFFHSLGDFLREPTVARLRLEDRLDNLGTDRRGPALKWAAGGELRVRFERVPLGWGDSSRGRRRARLAAGDATETRIGSLSLASPLGKGQAFLSLHGHPGWSFGLHSAGVIEPGAFGDDGAFASPFLSLARDGGIAGLRLPVSEGTLSVAAFRGAAQWGEYRDPENGRGSGAMLEYQWPSAERVGGSFQLGWMREAERLMGNRPRGAFGELSGRTGFVGATAHMNLGPKWTAFAAVHAGWSRPTLGRDGLLRGVSSLWTSSFGIGVTGRGLWDRDDRLSLSLSQPLRVETGRVSLRWAAGRTRDRLLRLEEEELSLKPTARQFDVEVMYSRLVGGGMLRLGTLASLHPGHARGASTDFAFLALFTRGF